ncbi:hypothetical protein OG884_26725 [Streptosporangium sp. NBC_01755]|uniref:hypothetical protein n=1 Tax=Streptosporangium sp. NBC_01755 TaxID=2975949 RepID=UPI002DDADE38|nr:hypothetical protein [Streptosporangium sp. NBC_01755]WSC98445.1 hypothetical protein OG884_26725 [Streptosporangium sp. NBC_01755]
MSRPLLIALITLWILNIVYVGLYYTVGTPLDEPAQRFALALALAVTVAALVQRSNRDFSEGYRCGRADERDGK